MTAQLELWVFDPRTCTWEQHNTGTDIAYNDLVKRGNDLINGRNSIGVEKGWKYEIRESKKVEENQNKRIELWIFDPRILGWQRHDYNCFPSDLILLREKGKKLTEEKKEEGWYYEIRESRKFKKGTCYGDFKVEQSGDSELIITKGNISIRINAGAFHAREALTVTAKDCLMCPGGLEESHHEVHGLIGLNIFRQESL